MWLSWSFDNLKFSLGNDTEMNIAAKPMYVLIQNFLTFPKYHKDSLERFDTFWHQKLHRNYNFRGHFYKVTKLAHLGVKNWQF